MDGPRFDAWTRRRFGLIAGGLVASSAGLLPLASAKKKGKKKKKRCKRFGEGCTPGGKRKCCGALHCDLPNGSSSFSCCKELGAPCSKFEDCCQIGNDVFCSEGICQII
jgi:hypothetical protein